MTVLTKKSLIIFDLDGTLIDSLPDLATAVNATLTTLNAPNASTNDIRNWVGNGSQALIKRALAWANLSADMLDEAHAIFLNHYANTHDDTRQYPGVTAGLEQLLKQGFLLALCTNKPTQFLPDIIQRMGWEDKFACILGGDSLPVKKPSGMPLLHICQTLDMDVAHTVMVGDSQNDVMAGKNAGMTTLGLTYGYNYGKHISQSNPDAVFDDFESLVNHLTNQFRK
ncbi:phosphoglycolate phosphatase [Moraxella sp. Tifton1]|uniref:Phosphoglycolate phosphatase n=1 Tax=Moraxella oculi TaxID=2940516 RepID=A0ABW8U564_9GAMM|nr:phosphoglycolate phosphatase [Moraxella sp. Tifton1]MCL1623236.1 phosphoglycolate phosphatase [Moraxella sp. Tifton1]